MKSFKEYLKESRTINITSKMPNDRINTGVYISGALGSAKSFDVIKNGKSFSIKGNNGSKLSFEVFATYKSVNFDITRIDYNNQDFIYSYVDIKGGDGYFELVSPDGDVICKVYVANATRTF